MIHFCWHVSVYHHQYSEGHLILENLFVNQNNNISEIAIS